MAAVYSGIHLRLRSPHTPWEDKLKLARFAWISTQCLLPNKEQVLLDWCTHALTGWYSQKVEFSHHVLEGLWHYLDDALHSKKLQLLLKQGKTISLRFNMAQLLLERLSEDARAGPKLPVRVSTVLSVCQGLFSSPALSSVFTTKYELMVALVATLCSLSCRELQQPVDDATVCLQNPKETLHSANLFDVLLQALSCYLSVQRQQANPNRVFAMVTNQLLQKLVLLRHLLTSGEFGPFHARLQQQLCRDIRTRVDSILKLSLFPSDLLTLYKEELLPPKGDPVKRAPGGAKGPFRPASAVLLKLCAEDGCEAALRYTLKSTTLPLMFKLFLESYRSVRGQREEEHSTLCFHFLTKLLLALDTGLDGHPPTPSLSGGSSPVLPESWSSALLAVESLLSQALSADIYNVAADRIRHEEVQLRFYRSVGQMLLNQAQPSIPAWYRCLKVLLSLNHLILEPDLDQLLSSAWVNSECMEPRVQKARENMVCSLLQVYTKLRQLPRLFSEILSVICQPALDHLRPPLLSEETSSSLRTCLLDIPSSQGLEICSSVLETIRTCILPDLTKGEGGVDDMETDGDEETSNDRDRGDASLKLFSLSQLLHVVLFNLKSLDNTSPLPVVRQSQRLMEDIQQTVRELTLALPLEPTASKTKTKKGKSRSNQDAEKTDGGRVEAPWVQKTQDSALLLQYTWVEVNMLFLIRCGKYTPLDDAPGVTTLERCTPPRRGCSPVSRLLHELLALQRMKKVSLDCASLSDPHTAALLSAAARSVLAEPEFTASRGGEQAWNRQIASVTSGSYAVAHWYVLVSNLPLLVPHLTAEDVGRVADVLVSSLLTKKREEEEEEEEEDCPPGHLTTSLLFSQLLQSSVLPELPVLFSATVHSLNRRIVSIIMEAREPTVNLALFEVPEKGCSRLFEKEALVQKILESLKTGNVAASLTDEQNQELVGLLHIVSHLNPDGMSSEDISSVFLLLLFVLTSTSAAPGTTRDGSDPALLVKLLRVLSCLVEGRAFHSVLKHIHGGPLLQAVVSSLSWRRRLQPAGGSRWPDVIAAAGALITCLVQVVINRNSSVRLNLDQFTCYLTGKEMATPASKPERPGSSDHLLLASLTSFSQAMVSNLGRSKSVDQTLAQLLRRTTSSLGEAVKSVLQPKAGGQSGNRAPSVPSQAFVVEVVVVMLRCELSWLSVEREQEQAPAGLIHRDLYQSFCQQILKELCSARRPTDFSVASLRFLSLFYKALKKTGGGREEEGGERARREKELDELHARVLQTVHELMSASWMSSADLRELEAAVGEVLLHLVEESSPAQFSLLLLLIRGALNTSQLRAGNHRDALSAVIIVKLLSRCHLPESCSKALWLLAPQIISALTLFIRCSSQDPSLTLPFTVPTVEAVTALLRQGEGLITSPHHVTVVLGALQAVPLDHLSPPDYLSAFTAVHEALFAIIRCHPQVMLKAAPSFLNVFHRLVGSIMQEGRQRGDSRSGPDGDAYLECSRLAERMYSHVAAAAESFTTLSSFMVAQYVTELQKVTLRPDIKAHLTEGIYRILDLCAGQDVKFLTAGLQAGVREVFGELYSSYTLHHRAQRQGEDKYTV